jgi:hypothetical protein
LANPVLNPSWPETMAVAAAPPETALPTADGPGAVSHVQEQRRSTRAQAEYMTVIQYTWSSSPSPHAHSLSSPDSIYIFQRWTSSCPPQEITKVCRAFSFVITLCCLVKEIKSHGVICHLFHHGIKNILCCFLNSTRKS